MGRIIILSLRQPFPVTVCLQIDFICNVLSRFGQNIVRVHNTPYREKRCHYTDVLTLPNAAADFKNPCFFALSTLCQSITREFMGGFLLDFEKEYALI